MPVRKAPFLPHPGTNGRCRTLWSSCIDAGSLAKEGQSGLLSSAGPWELRRGVGVGSRQNMQAACISWALSPG